MADTAHGFGKCLWRMGWLQSHKVKPCASGKAKICPPTGCFVNEGDISGYVDWMARKWIDRSYANADAASGARNLQQGESRRLIQHVVVHCYRVKSERFSLLCQRAIGRKRFVGLEGN